MIETWMEKHLVNGNNCNTVNLGMTNNFGLSFSVGDSVLQFKINIEQDIDICDTRYHI
jgi:hypothetical protein